MRLKWTDDAVADLVEIRAYILENDEQAAQDVATKILAQAESLLLQPAKGRIGRVQHKRIAGSNLAIFTCLSGQKRSSSQKKYVRVAIMQKPTRSKGIGCPTGARASRLPFAIAAMQTNLAPEIHRRYNSSSLAYGIK